MQGVLILKKMLRKKKSEFRRAQRAEVQRRGVEQFFDTHPEAWSVVQPYLVSEASSSKRLLEHFVTNYARAHRVRTSTGDDVYVSMQTTLLGLNKRLMDPFKRRSAHTYRGVETNVAQLTFFRWAYVHGVLQYVHEHEAEIRTDMRQRLADGATLPPEHRMARFVWTGDLAATATDSTGYWEHVATAASGGGGVPHKRRKRVVPDPPRPSVSFEPSVVT